MNRAETTVAQELGGTARPGHEPGSGRRQTRHAVAVVQAEIRRMHQRAAWGGRKLRGRGRTSAQG